MNNPVSENIEIVRQKIAEAARRAGRQPGEITLVAVSKTVSAELVRAAFDAGVSDFGENRIQEAQAKIKALGQDGLRENVRWHFIGHLQTNKAGAAIGMGFELIHAIDSIKLLGVLEEQARKQAKKQRALVEVKLSPEPSKHGVSEEGLMEILAASERAGQKQKQKHISIEGLMGMPPWSARGEDSRPYFARLRALKEKAEKAGFHLPRLSMGMTNDFEVAIEEGATLVRVGTAIFGSRTK